MKLTKRKGRDKNLPGRIEAISGGKRNDVGGDFTASGEMNNSIARKEAAGVVVAAGPGRRKALAAGAGLGSQRALSRAAAGRLVGGRDVAAVTVDPHELAAQVDGELDRNQRSPLVDLGDVLPRWVLCDGEDEGFGAEGGCGNGGGEDEEENGGEQAEGSGGRHWKGT